MAMTPPRSVGGTPARPDATTCHVPLTTTPDPTATGDRPVSTTPTNRRLTAICALVALAAAAVALWAMRPYAVGVYHDDGVYAILAKSLATGRGFRYLHLPGAPVAGHYPPVYPVFLSLLYRLVPQFPANVKLFLLANVALVGVAAWYTQALARRILGWSAAAAAAAALVATATFPMLLLSGLVLSETLFIAALLPLLVGTERFVSDPDPSASRASVHAVLLGASFGLLGLVRTHGLALALAAVLVLAWRRRWRDAALCLVGSALVMTPWVIWVRVHGTMPWSGLEGSYGSYIAWFSDGVRATGLHGMLSTVMKNAREFAELLADRWSFSDVAFARHACALLVATALGVGAWRMARRAAVTVGFLAIYMVVTLLWPFTPWRFFYAVWPIIVLCIGAAAEWSASVRPRVVRAAALAATTLLAVGLVRAEGRSYATRAWRTGTDQATATIAPLVRWVAAHTDSSDVVAADGEQVVYLFTGRTAVPIVPFTAAEYVVPRSARTNAAAIARLLRATHVDYLVTISPALRDAAGLLVRPDTASGAPRLAAMDAVGAGEAFRVERP